MYLKIYLLHIAYEVANFMPPLHSWNSTQSYNIKANSCSKGLSIQGGNMLKLNREQSIIMATVPFLAFKLSC